MLVPTAQYIRLKGKQCVGLIEKFSFAGFDFEAREDPANCVNNNDCYMANEVNRCPIIKSEIHSQQGKGYAHIGKPLNLGKTSKNVKNERILEGKMNNKITF